MEKPSTQKKPRICIIGAGPSGMCALYQIKLRELTGEETQDVECFEKQETMGGQWNYTWRTGTDEYGERVHGSLYKYMWLIGSKEANEFDDYSYKDHFGKALPSFVPREVVRQYLEGRFTKGKCGDISNFVKFRHVVSSVEYRAENDDFQVWVRDMVNNKDVQEIFSHVIVANGKYSMPDFPDFPGLNSFPGRVLHCHDLKDVTEFKDQTVLIIGASFSASDIAVQLIKHGTKRVVISEKVGPIGLKWPNGIEERPILVNVNGNEATFKGGTTAVVDSIMLCTGYIYDQGFLKGDLRYDYKTHTELYPEHLYKGTIWTKGGNNKLYMLAAYEEFFNFNLFAVQAEWILRCILGKLKDEPVSKIEMAKHSEEWRAKHLLVKSPYDIFAFQLEFALMLCKDIDYSPLHFIKAKEILDQGIADRLADMCTFRDKCSPNIYTGELAPPPKVTWLENHDESVEQYLD